MILNYFMLLFGKKFIESVELRGGLWKLGRAILEELAIVGLMGGAMEELGRAVRVISFL
jgi:hypothetical protein